MALTSGAGGGNAYPQPAVTGTGVDPVIGGAIASPASPVTAAGPSSYSGTFIPEIWSGKLIEKFYDATVLAAISNTDYEGEISNYGDTVHIRTRPNIAIHDYTPDTELQVQRPNTPVVDLTIDYAKYFNVVVDDVWEVQSDMEMMDMWAVDASEQLKIIIDTEIMELELLGSASADTSGATAGRISQNINLGITTAPVTLVANNPGAGERTVIDLLVDLGQALDESNVPETGRWVVLPAWVCALIKKSELRDASLTGDGVSMLRNGRLGMIDRFTIYMSNLLPSGAGVTGLAAGETAIFAGVSSGLTFASQMTRLETLRSERTFGTLLRGLQVYGAGVIKDDVIAEAIIARG